MELEYFPYVNLDARPALFGVARSNPPQTGGEVIDCFRSPLIPISEQLKVAAQRNRLQLLFRNGDTKDFAADQYGLDEALSEGGVLGRLGTEVRLVASPSGVELKGWNVL